MVAVLQWHHTFFRHRVHSSHRNKIFTACTHRSEVVGEVAVVAVVSVVLVAIRKIHLRQARTRANHRRVAQEMLATLATQMDRIRKIAQMPILNSNKRAGASRSSSNRCVRQVSKCLPILLSHVSLRPCPCIYCRNSNSIIKINNRLETRSSFEFQ